jgi:hypothetical protein
MVQNHQIMHTCLRGRQLCQIMHTCLRGRQLLLKHKTCKQFRPGEILVKHNADLPDVYFDILAVVHRNQLPRRGCMYKHIVVSEWDIYVLKLHYMWKQDKNPREIISVLKLHNMWKQVKNPREIISVLKLHYMWKQDKNPREIISVLKLHNMWKQVNIPREIISVLKLHNRWKQVKNPREIISVLKLHNMWKQVKIPREITVTAIVYVQQAIDYSWYKTTNYSTFKNVLFKYKKNLNNIILLMVY